LILADRDVPDMDAGPSSPGAPVVVVLVVALALGGVAAAVATPAIAQPSDPYVYVEDQGVDGTAQVVVGNATLPDGGFLVLRRGDNRAGEFVGATDYLEPGYLGRVEVPFEDRYYYAQDEQHVVIAIRDTDGDRELDGSDEVYDPGNGRAQDTFIIEQVVTPTPPEETPTRTATPDGGGPVDEPTETATAGTTAPAGLGGADDGAENQLTADSGGGSGPPLWLLGAGALLIVGAGVAVRLRGDSAGDDTPGADGEGENWRPDDPMDDAWDADADQYPHGEGGAAGGATGGASGADEATASQARTDGSAALQDRIDQLLRENGGRMKQADIVAERGWSETEVSQALSAMVDEDRVEKLRIGRETLVTLPDGETTDGVDESDTDSAGDQDTASVDEGAGTGAADGASAETGRDDSPAAESSSATATGGSAGASGDWRAMVPDPVPAGPDLDIAYDDLDIDEFVGGGGNADVHRASVASAAGPVTVAIKRPRARGTLHTEQVERFVDEAETWARLDDHDGIVDVLGWGSQPLPWLAMEYMDGGDLADRAGTVDLAEGLWTAVSLARAVRHAHRRGVAHLDLKPANVLFRECEGSWDAPKVADWGLSKHLIEHSASVEGMSPHYAAPEQFDDEYGAADDITDVYGLGAVTYELLTGRPPYEGRATEVMNAVMHEQPPAPSEVADLPAELDDVLLTALATEKADRYESVLYLRDDLQAILDDC
jgi:hypothetical protein